MNILVTGATRGIGKAVCAELKEHTIYASGRNEELLSHYEHYFTADLADSGNLEKLGEFISENKIDVLVNNAGEYIYSTIENTSIANLEHIMKVNLEAPAYLISKAVPYMKQNGFGRIINIGSISGVVGEANASLYAATKSGLFGLTKSLALELAEYGITVNTINPGWVDTEMGNTSAQEGEFSKNEIIECIPQKRFVSPEEVAGMVRYLISDSAKGVTGQTINICAGLTCGC